VALVKPIPAATTYYSTDMAESPIAPKALAFWPALGLIAVGDFVTKRLVESLLALHVPHPVIGDFVRMTLTYNPGAALNLSFGDWSRVLLSTLAVAMVVVLYRMYRTAADTDAWQALALGLVAGGAFGNLSDRIRSARGVVDFIDIGTADWRFWTFNVADSGVFCGAILLALILLRRPQETAQPAAEPQPVAAPSQEGPSGS
jgi:signal peptidase II